MQSELNFDLKDIDVNIEWTRKIEFCTLPDFDVSNVVYGMINDGIENGTSYDEYSIFKYVCNFDSLVSDIIVPETNRYAQQKGIEFMTDTAEVTAFLGISVLMGYHRLPAIRDYWSTQPDMRVNFVSDVMTLKRYEKIRQMLHFSNNEDIQPEQDRACKIRPIINHLNIAFQHALGPDLHQSIDERMVKFKGHNMMKQYIKNKPIKWGFKLWIRAGSSNGYVYEIDPYTGRKLLPEVCLGESVVLSLSKSLIGSGCHLFIDNFFNSPKLMLILHGHGILATGTVRQNRKGLPKNVKSDKNMKTGEMESFQSKDRKVNFIKWMDNRAVYALSNNISPIGKTGTSRRQKGNKERKNIDVPDIISTYNHKMGGVDLADQLNSYYENGHRSRVKYYLRLFFDLINTCIVNSGIVFNKIQQNHQLPIFQSLVFRRTIVRKLIGTYKGRIYATPTAPIKRRKSNEALPSRIDLPHLTHLPETQNVRKRCKLCTISKVDNRTNIFCSTCNASLCLTKERNCFKDYHHQ